MNTLQEIKQTLSDNLEQNLQILNSFLLLDVTTEEEFYNKLDICKYMKELCKTNNQFYNLYKNNFTQVDIEFFKYLFSKVNKKHTKKQWELMLFYINKAIWYYDLPQKELSFDSFEDYYIYTYLIQDNKITFHSSVESWVYYKQAVVHKNLGNLDLAVDSLKFAIQCSPMNFAYYEEMFSCLDKYQKYEELKDYLYESHKTVKTSQQLGMFYYYWTLYFYRKGNYSVAKACAYFASKNNLNLIYRNKLIDIVDTINNDDKLLTPYFKVGPEIVLKKYNIPTGYSKQMMMAVLNLYSKCVSKQILDKLILKKSRNLLETFKMNDYIEEITTNILTNDIMYHFDSYEFSFKLNKEWQTINIVDNDEFEEGTIFYALNNNDNFSIYLKRIKDYNFKEMSNLYINQFEKSGFRVVNKQQFTTLKNKFISLYTLKLEDDSTILSAFINIKDKYFCNIYISFKENFDNKKRGFLKILNSVNSFYTINHQDN